jgi:hypothetical protein
VNRNDCALRDGPDAEWQAALMIIADVLPASLIEEIWIAKVLREEILGLLHIGWIDNSTVFRADKVLLEDVLQAVEDDLLPLTSSRFEIGVDLGGAGWILAVMGFFVRI